MASDQEISRCVAAVLSSSTLPATATANDVVNQVEAKLGLELSHKAAFIRDQIRLLRPPPTPPPPPDPQLMYSYYQIPPGSFGFGFGFPGGAGSPPQQMMTAGGIIPQSPGVGGGGDGDLQVGTTQEAAGSRTSIHLQKKTAGSKTGVPARIKRKRGPGGLTRLCGVSPVLQTIVGEPVMPRTQIVKQFWAYIRKNNLQDPNNKRNIICNDELRLVLETDFTDIFKMNKQLAKHITPLEPSKDKGQDSKRLKAEDFAGTIPVAGTDPVAETDSVTGPDPVAGTDPVAETDPVAGPDPVAGTYPVAGVDPNAGSDPCPMVLSNPLTEFLGTGETELLQSEALGRICDYIKDNQLEDPQNSMILCDPKLQELFGCESLDASGIAKMLSCHLSEKP